jgi:O-antigen/teichoic acid export membrane protein
MLFTLGVGLFTARIVLDALGIIDYGLYNVIGGIVTLVSFMNNSLTGATNRFLNYAMGRGKEINLKTIFGSAIKLHIILSLIILILGETWGLWFLLNKISISAGRLTAALYVYQFSLFSIILTILRIPYNAAIFAHEKMSIYAYVSIFEAILKLLIAYYLYISSIDLLITYSFLLLIIQIIICFIYYYYCKLKFYECKYPYIYEKNYLKEIAFFFGWDIYGNFSVVVKNQGIVILQNIFFGARVNASVGIASTILSAVSGFTNNFKSAMKPQIFQSYAKKDNKKMMKLIYMGARFTNYMLLLIAVPIILESQFLLNIWLVEVPKYAVEFCRLSFTSILITSLFDVLLLWYSCNRKN